jgi:hypothetical protein
MPRLSASATPALVPPERGLRRQGLLARLRGRRLDHELAQGTPPWHSGLHAARSRQITGARCRRALARALERILDELDLAQPMIWTAAIPICREQVAEARPLLLLVAARLRADVPLAACGVARLRLLLFEGDSPMYARSSPDALALALENVLDSLQAVD